MFGVTIAMHLTSSGDFYQSQQSEIVICQCAESFSSAIKIKLVVILMFV